FRLSIAIGVLRRHQSAWSRLERRKAPEGRAAGKPLVNLVALVKKNNAADGRFGRALRGLQRFVISALMFLSRQPVCLQNIALISKSAEGQTPPRIVQRLLNVKRLLH